MGWRVLVGQEEVYMVLGQLQTLVDLVYHRSYALQSLLHPCRKSCPTTQPSSSLSPAALRAQTSPSIKPLPAWADGQMLFPMFQNLLVALGCSVVLCHRKDLCILYGHLSYPGILPCVVGIERLA